MRLAKSVTAAAVVSGLLAVLAAAPAQAAEATAPFLTITSIATPTNFEPPPSTFDEPNYEVRLENTGGAPTTGSPVVIKDQLPKGLTVLNKEFVLRYRLGVHEDFGPEAKGVCADQTVVEVTTVTCEIPVELPGSGEDSAVIYPGEELLLVIDVGLPGSAASGQPLANHVSVEGGGAPSMSKTVDNEVNATPAPAGFAEYSAAILDASGHPVTQAGSHPFQFKTSFTFNTRHTAPGEEESYAPSGGDPKDTPVALPPGLTGNPTAVTRCPLSKFNDAHIYQPFPIATVEFQLNECPNSSVVGFFNLRRASNPGTSAFPIYNLVPPPGMPAQLGFDVLNLPIFINTEVRPSENYKVVGTVHNITEARRVISGSVTLWGNPADHMNDPLRGSCLNTKTEFYPISIKTTDPSIDCTAGIPDKPFLRMPTSCATPLSFQIGLDTWTNQGDFSYGTATTGAPTGCDRLRFEPRLEARPTTSVADSPSGLHVDLHIPQSEPEGLGEADARDVSVSFPSGMSLNPSGANGLAGCSAAQIGLDASSLSGFNDAPASCPDSSRIGTVEVDTPLLEKTLHGSLFVAMPHENPFNSLLAVYIAVDDPETGVVVKLAGHVEADEQTGQITTTFDANPQIPFNDFRINLFEGTYAALRTPAVCGRYATTSVMEPWSAPESGSPATPGDTYAISSPPSGRSCPATAAEEPNAPAFTAGTVSPVAGAYSPFQIELRREDGSQEFSSLTVTPPPGLVGKLAGIPYCPQLDLEIAAHKSGREEEAQPSCPAASEVGTVSVAAGAGSSPYYATGRAYLTGPYKGAPLSLAIVTPAAAGPYDLGTVVVRSALEVNPETAQITAVSDPIPHILQGIPLDVRSVSVNMNRPDFTLNPTNCQQMAVGGQEESVTGSKADLSARFKVGDCARLGFHPRLSLKLKGQVKRTGHPAIKATLTYPKGDYANVSYAQVGLPHSEFLDQAHIKEVCTRPQLASRTCPQSSIYGHAKAWSPLLDAPLEGPVYLGVGFGHRLPDLVAELNGQIRVLLDGRVDTDPQDGIRSTFEVVPDAPVSKFVLEMRGGKKGLLENSSNICKRSHKAVVKLKAQNGRADSFRSPLVAQCGKHHGAGRAHSR